MDGFLHTRGKYLGYPLTSLLQTSKRLDTRRKLAGQFLENRSSDAVFSGFSRHPGRTRDSRLFETSQPAPKVPFHQAELLASTNRRLISPRRNEFLPRLTREGKRTRRLLQPSPPTVTHATRRGIYEAASFISA